MANKKTEDSSGDGNKWRARMRKVDVYLDPEMADFFTAIIEAVKVKDRKPYNRNDLIRECLPAYLVSKARKYGVKIPASLKSLDE